MSTHKYSTRLIFMIIIFATWIIFLTLQLTLLKSEIRLVQNIQTGNIITPHIHSLAKTLPKSSHLRIFNQYELDNPGVDGRILVVRLFGGTYVYIAVNGQQKIVDYKWYKT